MRIIFWDDRLKNFIHVCFLGLALLAGSIGFSIAQEKPEAELTPNLTVNIKLNSALGDKETEFYSKIAQDIINKLPRELLVDKNLVPTIEAFNEAHKHVNVVTYLPPTEGTKTDKRIQHFKIKFIFDENGANTSSEVVAGPVEEVGVEKKEETTPVVAAAPQSDVPVEEAATPAEKAPEENILADVGVKAPEAPQKAAETQPILPETKAPIEVADMEEKAKPLSPVVASREQTKPVKVLAVRQPLQDVRLSYEADDTALTFDQRKQLMALVHKVRQLEQPLKGFTFVVRAFHGPQGAETWLSEERLRFVTALLRQQDIDLSHGRVTEIFVHTDKNQFVEIHPIQ